MGLVFGRFGSNNIVFLFQLLVNSKIISLDLPVKDVYKKIWCPEGEVCFYLSYTYKMQMKSSPLA